MMFTTPTTPPTPDPRKCKSNGSEKQTQCLKLWKGYRKGIEMPYGAKGQRRCLEKV